MNPDVKKKLLESARSHVEGVRQRILEAIAKKERKTTSIAKEAPKMMRGDALAQRKIMATYLENIEHLKQMHPSPYFNYCEFIVNGERKKLFFSKFSFNEENIYSWVTPAATLRFEKPGEAFYLRPDGNKQVGLLVRKDQYMIVDGKIIFFSTEESGKNRELIHQEHFTKHKQGFILPEVVEQMEKAQDQVVRAHFQGPFLISGPAGSGKTTLALHRIAYLLQSPETAEYFSPESILVMVQDSNTKEYFSHLLPDLGIIGISIVTFADWAFSVLGLVGYAYASVSDLEDTTRFSYESAKLSAIRTSKFSSTKSSVYSALEDIYSSMNKTEKAIFIRQKSEKKLDRIDLCALLRRHLLKNEKFTVQREYYEETASGKYRKRTSDFEVQYNLAVIDEFQNYLPEQIRLFKSCINPRLNSLVYVGDLAQQTQLGTLKDWQSIGERLDDDRMVTLQKVYRNTKQILGYINSLGYKVAIPEEIKNGPGVKEMVCNSKEEEIEYIKKNLSNSSNTSIGILCKEKKYLEEFKETFKEEKNIYCFSFSEAQGVEFDQVFIVGVNTRSFLPVGVPEEIVGEVKKIYKDLLYVALTRAMGELHVIGEDALKKCAEQVIL